MTGAQRQPLWVGGALAVVVGAMQAPTAPGQPPRAPSIAWESAAGSPTVVAVGFVALPSAVLDPLRTAGATDPRWSSILTVRVANADGSVPPDRPAILGAYRVEAHSTLRFTPRFPLDATRRYQATFDPDGPSGPAPSIIVDRLASPRPVVAPTRVARVEPIGDRLPENLLRFYVHFSAPMSRGEAYTHLGLEDAAGQPLDHPFLELGEELWDPTGTRLTVLLDPGRIKRGLRPRQELGPIFTAGRTYRLKIDPAWRDAAGQPLAAPASKTFTTGPADETSPDPKTWKITPPRAGSTNPLVVGCADALDRATVASGLTLLDPQGAEVAGTAEAHADGTGWQFTPEKPWRAGTYSLAINPDLEDLAGNSIRRPFEVDVQRDVPIAPEVTHIELLIVIKS